MRMPDRYTFRPRTQRVNWQTVRSFSFENAEKDGDVTSLEALMENITFSHVDSSELRDTQVSDFVKLIRLLQMSIDYLLSSNRCISEEAAALRSRHASTSVENRLLGSTIRSLKKKLLAYTKEVALLRTERGASKESHPGPGLSNRSSKATEYYRASDNNFAPPNQQSRSHHTRPKEGVTVFSCKLCNKKFETFEFLQKHQMRRHPQSVVDSEGMQNMNLNNSANLLLLDHSDRSIGDAFADTAGLLSKTKLGSSFAHIPGLRPQSPSALGASKSHVSMLHDGDDLANSWVDHPHLDGSPTSNAASLHALGIDGRSVLNADGSVSPASPGGSMRSNLVSAGGPLGTSLRKAYNTGSARDLSQSREFPSGILDALHDPQEPVTAFATDLDGTNSAAPTILTMPQTDVNNGPRSASSLSTLFDNQVDGTRLSVGRDETILGLSQRTDTGLMAGQALNTTAISHHAKASKSSQSRPAGGNASLLSGSVPRHSIQLEDPEFDAVSSTPTQLGSFRDLGNSRQFHPGPSQDSKGTSLSTNLNQLRSQNIDNTVLNRSSASSTGTFLPLSVSQQLTDFAGSEITRIEHDRDFVGATNPDLNQTALSVNTILGHLQSPTSTAHRSRIQRQPSGGSVATDFDKQTAIDSSFDGTLSEKTTFTNVAAARGDHSPLTESLLARGYGIRDAAPVSGAQNAVAGENEDEDVPTKNLDAAMNLHATVEHRSRSPDEFDKKEDVELLLHNLHADSGHERKPEYVQARPGKRVRDIDISGSSRPQQGDESTPMGSSFGIDAGPVNFSASVTSPGAKSLMELTPQSFTQAPAGRNQTLSFTASRASSSSAVAEAEVIDEVAEAVKKEHFPPKPAHVKPQAQQVEEAVTDLGADVQEPASAVQEFRSVQNTEAVNEVVGGPDLAETLPAAAVEPAQEMGIQEESLYPHADADVGDFQAPDEAKASAAALPIPGQESPVESQFSKEILSGPGVTSNVVSSSKTSSSSSTLSQTAAAPTKAAEGTLPPLQNAETGPVAAAAVSSISSSSSSSATESSKESGFLAKQEHVASSSESSSLTSSSSSATESASGAGTFPAQDITVRDVDAQFREAANTSSVRESEVDDPSSRNFSAEQPLQEVVQDSDVHPSQPAAMEEVESASQQPGEETPVMPLSSSFGDTQSSVQNNEDQVQASQTAGEAESDGQQPNEETPAAPLSSSFGDTQSSAQNSQIQANRPAENEETESDSQRAGEDSENRFVAQSPSFSETVTESSVQNNVNLLLGIRPAEREEAESNIQQSSDESRAAPLSSSFSDTQSSVQNIHIQAARPGLAESEATGSDSQQQSEDTPAAPLSSSFSDTQSQGLSVGNAGRPGSSSANSYTISYSVSESGASRAQEGNHSATNRHAAAASKLPPSDADVGYSAQTTKVPSLDATLLGLRPDALSRTILTEGTGTNLDQTLNQTRIDAATDLDRTFLGGKTSTATDLDRTITGTRMNLSTNIDRTVLDIGPIEPAAVDGKSPQKVKNIAADSEESVDDYDEENFEEDDSIELPNT